MKFHAWGKLKLTIKLLVVPVPCSLVPLERNLPALPPSTPPNLIEIMAHGWMDVPTMLPSLARSWTLLRSPPVAADGLHVPSPFARPPDSSWRRFTESRGGTREGGPIERREDRSFRYLSPQSRPQSRCAPARLDGEESWGRADRRRVGFIVVCPSLYSRHIPKRPQFVQNDSLEDFVACDAT